MAYDEALASRFRTTLDGVVGISEKRMMGGVCFFLNGNMIGGADRTKSGAGRFMFRVGKDNQAKALSRPGASIVEMGGKRMGGLVFVEDQLCDAAALNDWVAMAFSFIGDMPAK